MAGSTISVNITGDATGFTKATNVVTNDMTNVTKSSAKQSADLQGNLKEAGKSFRGVGELAKGLGDAFGFPLGGIVDLSNTMKDLSKGAAETIAPAIEKLQAKFGGLAAGEQEATAATEEATTAQEGLNVAEDANPLGAIIEAITLVALGFTVLWQNCGTFRDIVKAVFAEVQQIIGDAVSFISDHWKLLADIFLGPIGLLITNFGLVKSAVSDVADAVSSAFKAAFNFVADAWNATVGQLHFSIPGWVPGIGGDSFGVPQMPHFAAGGVMAMSGQALVGEHGPEVVSLPAGAQVHPHGSSMGGMTVQINATGPTLQDIVSVAISQNARKTKTAVTSGASRAFA